MSTNTSIEWTEATWNPLRGCRRVSPGCVHCYAEAVAARFCGPGQPYEGLAERTPSGPRWTGTVRLVEDALTLPLHWRKPRRIFVNSMSDLFHEDVPDEWIERIFAVMFLAERHTFQVLTKRPARMRQWFAARRFDSKGGAILQTEIGECYYAAPWPLPNVWLGVSVEDQQRADERIPLLLQTPAAVRFISAEPLLGPVDLERVQWPQKHRVDVLRGGTWELRSGFVPKGQPEFVNHSDMERLDWVIVGGESGSGARPCDVAWVRDIVRQCREAGVACFVKQLGAAPLLPDYATGEPVRLAYERERADILSWPSATFGNPTDDARLNGRVIYLRDRKGGDPSEWSDDLRVRQWPEMRHA